MPRAKCAWASSRLDWGCAGPSGGVASAARQGALERTPHRAKQRRSARMAQSVVLRSSVGAGAGTGARALARGRLDAAALRRRVGGGAEAGGGMARGFGAA